MKSLLLAAYLLVVQTVHAQFKEELPHLCQTNKQGDTLRITNIFIKDTGELLKEYYKDAQDCSVLFLGVRFQINNHGEVCNLNASINTPDFLKKLLEKNLRQTSHHWSARKINGVAVDSDPIIITYYLSIEPSIDSYACNDLSLLLSRATSDLPALQFSEYQPGDYLKPIMHGTLYQAGIIRVRIFKKGWVK